TRPKPTDASSTRLLTSPRPHTERPRTRDGVRGAQLGGGRRRPRSPLTPWRRAARRGGRPGRRLRCRPARDHELRRGAGAGAVEGGFELVAGTQTGVAVAEAEESAAAPVREAVQ